MAVCFKTTSVGKIQAITYFVSVILSFCVVVPVGITLRNFQGSCILFAQLVWDGTTIWPYSEPCCDFVLYMNLACTLLYGFLMGIFSLCVAVPKRFPFGRHYAKQLKPHEDQEQSFRIMAVNPVFMFINMIIMFMTLSSAIVITVGLGRFCGWAIDGATKFNLFDDGVINSCADVQNKFDWSQFKIIRGETMGVKGDQFYASLGIATVASWLLFLDWLFQWILNLSQSCTMFSCEIAEEKRKPDQALLIAARRSRLSTPIHTPGRYTPPMHGQMGDPMRPYAFRPQPGVQYTRPQQSAAQQTYLGRPPQPEQQRFQMQQGYVPPHPPQPEQQRFQMQQGYVPPQPEQQRFQMQQGYLPPQR